MSALPAVPSPKVIAVTDWEIYLITFISWIKPQQKSTLHIAIYVNKI